MNDREGDLTSSSTTGGGAGEGGGGVATTTDVSSSSGGANGPGGGGGGAGPLTCDVTLTPARASNRARLFQLVGAPPTSSGLDIFGYGNDGAIHAHVSGNLGSTATTPGGSEPLLAPHPDGGAVLANGDVFRLTHSGAFGTNTLVGTSLFDHPADQVAEAAFGGSSLFLRLDGGAIHVAANMNTSTPVHAGPAVRLSGYPEGIAFGTADGRLFHCPGGDCASATEADLGALVAGDYEFPRLIVHPPTKRVFAVARIGNAMPPRTFMVRMEAPVGPIEEFTEGTFEDVLDLALVGDRLVTINQDGEAAVCCLDVTGYPAICSEPVDIAGAQLVAPLPGEIAIPNNLPPGLWPGVALFRDMGALILETYAITEAGAGGGSTR